MLKPHIIERRAHRRAEREAPTGSHPLRWFSLLPFTNRDTQTLWAIARNRAYPNR